MHITLTLPAQPRELSASTAHAVRVLGLALVYAVVGKLGLALAIIPGYATAVWPPSGIALAAALVFGRSALPGVWLGSFLANAWHASESAAGLDFVNGFCLPAIIGLGAAAQAGAGWAVVERYANPQGAPLGSVHNVILLIIAAPLTALVNSVWSVTTLAAAGAIAWGEYGLTWWTWWLGDSTGILLFAPALLGWGERAGAGLGRKRTQEMLLNFALLFLLGQFVYGGWFQLVPPRYPLSFVAYPLVILSAYRFGTRGSTGATLIISAIMLVGTAGGTGPFAGRPFNEALLLAQAFAAMVSASSLVLAAAVAERDAAAERVRASGARTKAILDSSFDSIITIDGEGIVRAANPACERTFGLKPEEMFGKPMAELIIPPAMRPAHNAGLKRALRTGESEMIGRMVEMPALRADGKEFPAEVFVTRIDLDGEPGFTAHVRDITSRKLAERQLRHYATHDPLTGAANRTLFFDTLRKVMAAARREDLCFALVYVDLDGFKAVNDAHGHAAGDVVLVQATDRIRACLRERDMVARLGGDEFVVLLNGLAGPEEADAVAERINDALRKEYRVEGLRLPLSASLGIAMSTREPMAAEDMMRIADAAMYSCKRGRPASAAGKG